MLTNAILWKDQEALALKKGDSTSNLSEVNGICIITLNWKISPPYLVPILQLRTKNPQRERRRNWAIMCPVKSKRNYTMKWDQFRHHFFLFAWYFPFSSHYMFRYLMRGRRKGWKMMWVSAINNTSQWFDVHVSFEFFVLFFEQKSDELSKELVDDVSAFWVENSCFADCFLHCVRQFCSLICIHVVR